MPIFKKSQGMETARGDSITLITKELKAGLASNWFIEKDE